MRKLAWITAASGVLALTVVLGSGLLGGQGVSAQGTVNFDIDPDPTGNTASTLGTVEDCVEIVVASPSFDGTSDYNIDIVVTGDTQAPIAYDASMNYDATKVHIAPTGTDTLIKTPGGFDLGETGTPPDTDGIFTAGVLMLAGAGTAGDGTIVRVGLDIGVSGLVTFSLGDPPLTFYGSDAGSHPLTKDTGMLAINVGCPAVHPDYTIGIYEPSTGLWSLRNTNDSGPADLTFSYGAGISGGVAVVGDWDGDGDDTIGIYDPSTGLWYLRNTNDSGPADLTFSYGAGISGGVPVAGDWDGYGVDTVGIYRPSDGMWFLRNTNDSGEADLTFSYGAGISGGVPVASDWDGNEEDSIGIYNPSTGLWFLRNTNDSGPADLTFSYGAGISGGSPVAGDWDRNFEHSIGIYNPSTGLWFLRNTNDSGPADLTFSYGAGISGGSPVAGDWDGL